MSCAICLSNTKAAPQIKQLLNPKIKLYCIIYPCLFSTVQNKYTSCLWLLQLRAADSKTGKLCMFNEFLIEDIHGILKTVSALNLVSIEK